MRGGGPMMASRMEFMNMPQQMQGGPPMPGTPQMNNMRGPMMRGPPPPPGGMAGPPRMQGYPRGMMMPDGAGGGGGGQGMMGGGGAIRIPEKEIFNEDIRRVLIQWLKSHKHHPYATEGEFEQNDVSYLKIVMYLNCGIDVFLKKNQHRIHTLIVCVLNDRCR